MAQQFANQAQSVLATPYNAGDSTLTLVTASAFSTTGNFTVALGNPIQFYLQCTARSGNTLTVLTTGQEGTTAVGMPSGSTVTQVVTSGVLTGLKTDIISSTIGLTNTVGPFASLPGSGTYAGQCYDCTDAFYSFVWTGSAWQAYAFGYPVTLPPSASGFAAVNGGSLTNVLGTLVAVAGGSTWSPFTIAQPTVPYSLQVGVMTLAGKLATDGTGYTTGVLFSDGTKFMYSYYSYYNNTNYIQYNSTVNTFVGAQTTTDNLPLPGSGIQWYKIVNDGVHRTYYMGNPQYWVQTYQEAYNANSLTPTQIGLATSGGTGSILTVSQYFHYKLGTS
jgi:hypothetical protein